MHNNYIAEWTFLSQIKSEQVPILLNGEQALFTFRTKGSTALFTNARLVVADATARETSIFSIPYSAMIMWNSSTVNNTSSYEIYTSVGVVKITLKKDIDPIKFGCILAKFILSKKK